MLTEQQAYLLLSSAAELPKRVVDGQFLRLETGERHTAIQCSDFNLLARYVAGQDITPVLRQRQACGFNSLRVWTIYAIQGIGYSPVSDALYAAIPGFVRQCAGFGLYVDVTAFTGPYVFMSDDVAKITHWERLLAAATFAPSLTLELGNEIDHPANRDLPMFRLRRPTTVLASSGSMTADRWPAPEDSWDLLEYHTNDLDEWWRKAGHNAFELASSYGHPCIANENTRFPDRDGNTTHAFDAAAGAALLCAGACFHSVHGKTSELWDGRELECAIAWAAGARSVPLEFQTGQYHHRKDLEGPGILRAYDRTLPAGQSFVVEIRA